VKKYIANKKNEYTKTMSVSVSQVFSFSIFLVREIINE
jgi:hypothetical protein